MDVLYAFIKSQELRALIEPTSPRPDAATAIVNLPDYRVNGDEAVVKGRASNSDVLGSLKQVRSPSLRSVTGLALHR